jgi:hypothetical protein
VVLLALLRDPVRFVTGITTDVDVGNQVAEGAGTAPTGRTDGAVLMS